MDEKEFLRLLEMGKPRFPLEQLLPAIIGALMGLWLIGYGAGWWR